MIRTLLRSLLAFAADGGGPPSLSDEELFARYCRGDADAFHALWTRYAKPLQRTMARQVRQPEHAAELVQAAFLNLHRARKDFRTGALVRPWLYTIALNLRREYFRRAARRKELPYKPEQHGEGQVDPVDLEIQEQRAQVRAALAQLPENQRIVIQLHWFDGLGFSEIATVVGASRSAVKVRAHRGYKILRTTLGPCNQDAAEPVQENGPTP